MLYKVLAPDNKAIHGGSFDYSEYIGQDWTPPIFPVKVCESGYHLTQNPWKWYTQDAIVYIAEGVGSKDIEEDKVAFERVYLKNVSSFYNNQFRRFENLPKLYEAAGENAAIDIRDVVQNEFDFSVMRKDLSIYQIDLSEISETYSYSKVHSLARRFVQRAETSIMDSKVTRCIHPLSILCNDYVQYGIEDAVALYRIARFKTLLRQLGDRIVLATSHDLQRAWVI